jgi:Tfp pilus assembly protein PilF
VHFKAQPRSLSRKEFRGRDYFEAGDIKLASSAFKKVLEADPGHASATRGLRVLACKEEELAKKNSGLGQFFKR